MGFFIITGATKGIGKAIAEGLAQRGKNLILIARSEDILRWLSLDFADKYKVQVLYLVLDLTQADFIKNIEGFIVTKGLEVEGLVNNAGFGKWGRFDKMKIDKVKAMMRLNMSATVELTHKILNLRKGHQPLYVLNIASTASFQPVPYFSVYAASKIFILSFSRALREELKQEKVYVSCLCPGPTRTEFFSKAEASHTLLNSGIVTMKPEKVARSAIKGMFKKKEIIIPGLQNKINYFGSKIFPVSLVLKIVKAIMKYPQK